LESILFATGAINRKGSITDGNTAGDSGAEFRTHQMRPKINVASIVCLGDELTSSISRAALSWP